MAEKQRKGFAVIPPERLQELASQGGQAARDKGTLHKFTPQEASEGGKAGGASISRDRDHMSRIGRKGGLKSKGRRKKSDDATVTGSGEDGTT